MNSVGIIPARFASSRFPGKPLVDINGKPMIQHVYEQALKSKFLNHVCVATDNLVIHQRVLDFGGNSILTSSEHISGTDRIFEAATKLEIQPDVVINIQGDEPFINPQTIDDLAQQFADFSVQIASVALEITDASKINNPDVVKVIKDKNDLALYFSRLPIPFLRSQNQSDWMLKNSYFQHIGLYAYRFEVLKEIVALPPSMLEMAESLEQLRWLENGFKIKMLITQHTSFGIDTPEDLKYALEYLKNTQYGFI